MRKHRHYRRPGVRSSLRGCLDEARARELAELAGLLTETGQSAQAVSALEHALVLHAADTGLRRTLAQAYWRDGQFQRALAWSEHPDLKRDPAAALLQARVLADAGRLRQSLVAYSRALALAPGKSEILLERAAVKLRAGQLAMAESDLDSLLERSPESIRALALRSHLKLEQGRGAEAIEDLSRIPEEQRRVEHLLLMAQARRQAGQSPESIDATFRQAEDRFPRDGRILLAHARYLAGLRGHDARAAGRAEVLLRDLLADISALEPSLRAQARFLLAELIIDRSGKTEQAEDLYRQGLHEAPRDARGMEGLGRCLLAQGQAGQAVHWLLSAVLSEPERPSGLNALARALSALRDPQAVRRWLGLLLSALPAQAPDILSRMLQAAGEAGRSQATEDLHRQAHRMKNRLAVTASRARAENKRELAESLDELFEEWTRFLSSMRHQPPAPRIHAAAGLLRRAIAEATAEPERVQLSQSADLPLLRVDAPALVDALANLIRNGLEASPPRAAVRIHLRGENEGNWLRVAITDRGPGIPFDMKDRIFDAGFSEGKQDGSGLGLSISRQVIRSHGGSITVASAEGGPTTFVIMLPGEQAWAPLPGLLVERILAPVR